MSIAEHVLKEFITNYVRYLQPYMRDDIISGLSCAPVIELCEQLKEFNFNAVYYDGAKVMNLEDRQIPVLDGSMRKSLGSVFIVPDDEAFYVPYSSIIQTMAQLIGAGRKEAPFVDAEPYHTYIMDHYWKWLVKNCLEVPDE